LRCRGLGGWKFRRQQIVAGYIVDFYCAKLRLAIEVDGAVHEGQHEEDRQRDINLAALGVRVIRVGDADVLARLDDVLSTLSSQCEIIAEAIGVRRHDARRPPKLE
jgi:very-short-patch-repair endonuclease